MNILSKLAAVMLLFAGIVACFSSKDLSDKMYFYTNFSWEKEWVCNLAKLVRKRKKVDWKVKKNKDDWMAEKSEKYRKKKRNDKKIEKREDIQRKAESQKGKVE